MAISSTTQAMITPRRPFALYLPLIVVGFLLGRVACDYRYQRGQKKAYGTIDSI